MTDRTHVIAGRCTTTFDDGQSTREQHGDAVVVCKPDDTVLVHDATGYQPMAWLTRAERVAIDGDAVTAWDGDSKLHVTVEDRYGGGQYPTGPSGTPVGDCPDCDGPLLRASDAVVVCKPDDTVLVHDATGYQPMAWLTRAERVAIDGDAVTAWDGDSKLHVTVQDRYGGGQYPTGPSGTPVGDCPDCDGPLLRTSDAVVCADCDERYGLPTDADVLDDRCNDCGLPRIAVDRGDTFELCVDWACESLDERVAEAFDRAWDCPSCGDDLRVLRQGGLILGCASYPACDVTLSFPAGTVVDECSCGLPVFETATGQRCLDPTCERAPAATETPQGL